MISKEDDKHNILGQMNMRYDYYCSIRKRNSEYDLQCPVNVLVLSIHRCARHDRHAEWRFVYTGDVYVVVRRQGVLYWYSKASPLWFQKENLKPPRR